MPGRSLHRARLLVWVTSGSAAIAVAPSVGVARPAKAAAHAIAAGKGTMLSAPSAAAHCDRTVEAGANHLAVALQEAKPGAHLCLLPGTHTAQLSVTKSVTLTAAKPGEVVLVGQGRDAVLRVDEDGISLRLENLVLQGGVAQAGGGLAVYGRGKVHAVGCTFQGNQAGMVGGGGVYVRAGLAILESCEFKDNVGRQGGAAMFDMACKAELTRCSFVANRADSGGALRIAEAAEVDLKACHVLRSAAKDGASVVISGTRSRTPKVSFDHCEADSGTLVNGPEIPGQVAIKASKVPASWRGVAGSKDGGGNTWQALPAGSNK